METLILLLLMLINGFFAMSEIALVSARRARLQNLVDSGDRAARVALALGEDPTRFLSTIQIGITSVALLSGIVGEATLAPPLADRLRDLGLEQPAAGYAATAIVVALVTYFSIVVGELVPKRVGQLHAESVARVVARPVRWLSLFSRPFVWLLTGSTRALLRLLRIDDASRQQPVTEEEIHAVLEEGTSSGAIEESEHRMVRNLFRLDDRPITTLMTPRADIVYLTADASLDEILRRLDSSPHTRYPIVRGSLQNVIGIASARHLLVRALRGLPLDLAGLTEPALFIPEGTPASEVLETFRSGKRDAAFIVDEYGSVLGLVTLHDFLEAIAGEFASHGEEPWAQTRADGSWLFDGQIPMTDVADHLGVTLDEDTDRGDFRTLSGLVMSELGRVPRATESIEWSGWRFEVVDMDGHRIDKVLAQPLPAVPEAAVDGDA